MTRAIVLAMSGALALSACAAGPAPRIETPTPVLPASFGYAPDGAVGRSLVELLPMQDPAYAKLSAAALGSSPSLAEAMARIERARAGARRAAAERLPAVNVDAGVTTSRTNPAQFAQALPPGIAIDPDQTSYAANLSARWDLDIFGRLKAQERAARARIDAADAAARGIRIALLAEIAASVTDWRTLMAREQELQSDLRSAERLASLAAVRERAGIAPGFDRIRADSSAASARSRIAALDSERARLIGRLVTLTAGDAGEVKAALTQAAESSALPAAPVALPSSLLTNRPDVLAAAANLAAADAELAAAARARFPVFNLSATLGLLGFGLDQLFTADSVVGSLGAGVAAPLLDFGRIQAGIDAAAADKQAAYQGYRGAVFTALGEAEAAYGLVSSTDREARAALAEASALQRAASIADSRYRAGLADFLTVLESRRAADASGERAAQASGRARRARIILWQALGGSD